MKFLFPSARLGGIAAMIGVLTIVLATLLGTPGHAAWWDTIPGFWSVFGFLSCAIIIVVSKALGKWFLQKPESFYDA